MSDTFENSAPVATDAPFETPAVDPEKAAAKAADLSKARDYGWNETTAFNYTQYQQVGGDYDDWLGAAKVYEWQDEYGDVAPEVPELEAALYGTEARVTEGGHRENLDEIEVTLEGPTKFSPIQKVSATAHHTSPSSTRLTCNSSKMAVCTQSCSRISSAVATASPPQFKLTLSQR